jgi:hypothetical protein
MLLNTKEKREKSREYQFNYLQQKGFIRQDYKSAVIFHHPELLQIKTYHGTAANHTEYIQFRTIAALLAKIEKVKENADSREQWKAKQKEENKGRTSRHAAAAAALREELKSKFPGFKFSVTSESFSMGDAVRVSWTDGPKTSEVEKISGKYQYGHFDGMSDMYENTNCRDDIPQAKYVTESRHIADETLTQVKEQIRGLNYFDFENLDTWSQDNLPDVARRLVYSTSFPANYKRLKVIIKDRPDVSGLEGGLTLEFETEQQPEKEQPKPLPQGITPGKIQFIDYSEKAFAVIGDTKTIKDTLHNLGGSFNARLSCGPGWIFSKKRMEDVKAALQPKKSAACSEVLKAMDSQEEPNYNEALNAALQNNADISREALETELQTYI